MVRAVVWLPGLAVALGAAVATAHGLYEVALAARVPAGIAWLYPLITDGLALVAYAATARLHGRARPLRLGGGRARRRPVRARPSRLPRRRHHHGRAEGAAVRGRRLARGRRRRSSRTCSTSWPPTTTAARTAAGVQPAAVQTGRCTARRDHCSTSSCSTSRGRARSTGRPDRCPADPPASSARPQRPDDGAVRRSGPSPARDRARAAAARHAHRHGRLPTVSELATAAEVSRGTAATALTALREQPAALHLITDTPDQGPQP